MGHKPTTSEPWQNSLEDAVKSLFDEGRLLNVWEKTSLGQRKRIPFHIRRAWLVRVSKRGTDVEPNRGTESFHKRRIVGEKKTDTGEEPLLTRKIRSVRGSTRGMYQGGGEFQTPSGGGKKGTESSRKKGNGGWANVILEKAGLM